MAGRGKDFTFNKEALDRGLADVRTIADHAALVADMPQANALLPWIESLQLYLKGARTATNIQSLKELIKRLRLF